MSGAAQWQVPQVSCSSPLNGSFGVGSYVCSFRWALAASLSWQPLQARREGLSEANEPLAAQALIRRVCPPATTAAKRSSARSVAGKSRQASVMLWP